MSLLAPISQWPVDNAAAALLCASPHIDAPSKHSQPKSERQPQSGWPGGTGVELSAEYGDVARVFPLASVTKLLSAYAFLIAVEEGVMELETLAPHPAPSGTTVRHLLAHASGVGFQSSDRIREPEKRRIYSSYGFELLAELVERESGIDFPDYLHEAVCAPLGMRDTVLTGSAGHGAESSVNDLSRFAVELLRPTLLSRQMHAQMRQVHYPDLIGVVPGYGMHKPCPWGLGVEVKGEKNPHWTGKSMPPSTIGHFGMSGTYLWAAPEHGHALVVLTDRDFGDWAKPLWSDFNEDVWTQVEATSTSKQ